MKFTRDICRLLGIGGDDQEEMEVGGGASDQTDGGGGDSYISQDTLSGEECLSEEEKNRRRAEKRRAKRKRQKQRKKLEKEEKLEDSPGQGQGEGRGGAWESDSDEEEKTAEEGKKNTGRVVSLRNNKETPPPPAPARPAAPPPALVTTRNTGNNRQPPACRAVEEEPEWDVNSAFVAGAASHIKPKGRRGRGRAGQSSRENKENESRSSQVESSKDPLKRRGVALTEEGIQMFKQGLYSQAVDMFTAAIHCDPTDHRFYGNRSYCYWCLELYSAALSDAQRSIKLAPDWPKGHFRKGSALMGLKRYSDAEKAMEQVLKLDEDCEEATNELFNCRVLQLMDLGFDEFQGVLLLEKFTTVQAALGSCDLKEHSSQQDLNGGPCPSLWVGNVTVDITEKDIRDLFKTYGEIESIRVLHERFCAFVNFKNANMAATALERLHGVELEGSRLVIRYPDRWLQRTLPTLQRTNCGLNTSSSTTGPRRSLPINGDECFFWRTTGCFYGDKCRFRHIPEQRGRDKKPWQP